MTPLSPLDALGPAFRRTREVLATPFRLGFFLKIALIAALTQPSFYSVSISYPINGLQFALIPHRLHFGAPEYTSHFQGGAGLAALGIAAVMVVALIGVALWVAVAYLYCRLRFALFDLVVYKQGSVRQSWSKYRRQPWRYFGLVILVSLAFMVIAVIVIGPALLNLIRTVRPLAAAGPNANPFQALGAMLPFFAAILALGVLWAFVDALMQDFLLPPMAIEDAPLESAFGRFFALLKTNSGSVLVYILLRFAVGIGMTWILLLGFMLVLAIPGLVVFGVGTLLYHALWTSVAGQVLCVALALLIAVVAVAIYLLGIIAIYGSTAVFKQSYAAYFFAGRYSQLGDRLEPPLARTEGFEPPPTSPPSPPPNLPLSDAPVW